ncbi:hypothetical protein GOP47_0016782 [Adiantum capillus-veneris]|uniref:RRM domain-containing protein n=1 Tax=Adiantum capillus-veneris TaxID=13818 RepID=A0A9D4ZC13_ADICA|nr:hypothetical protein GOP47_0016782 [Adiantum capillus-veneris]
MVSACFSSVNGSLAAAAASTTRPEGRLTLLQAPRSLRTLRPFELRMLSLSVPRKGLHRHGYGVVGQAHAELSVEEVQALDASSDEDEREEGDSLDNGPSFRDNGPPFGESVAKLYVGNLPWSCNSEELAGVFQKVGSVDMVEVIYDKESGRSRGFGFVTMSSVEDCNTAIEKLDGADYAGRTLRVNFPNRNRGDAPTPRAPRMDQNNSNKLFVGNLAWGVDDGMLHDLFSEHGKVLEARVVNDRETGRSRGFGFVTMSTEAEVNQALNKMDGAAIEGRNLRVNMAGERPSSRSDFF